MSREPRCIRPAPGWVCVSLCVATTTSVWPQPPVQPVVIDRPEGVSIKLGAANEENGLKQRDAEPEHKTRVITVGGRECRATDRANRQFYMDFDVDDKYLYSVNLPVRVTVEYYDEGKDWFALKYDSNDQGATGGGRSKVSDGVVEQDAKTWKRHTFNLPDARFSNQGVYGADFGIILDHNAGGGDVCIAFVAVIVGGLQVTVVPPAVSADGKSSCQVRALICGSEGAVKDGTPVKFSANRGSITPELATVNGRAVAPFRAENLAGEARVTVASPEDQQEVTIPVLLGEGQVLEGAVVVHTFEHLRGCRTEGTTPTTQHRLTAPGTEMREDRTLARLEYEFVDTREKRPQIRVHCEKPLPGLPTKVSVWVCGDKSYNQLHVWLLDSTGQVHDYLLGYVAFDGWRLMEQSLGSPLWHVSGKNDGVLHLPVRLMLLLVAPYYTAENRKMKGAFHVQDLRVETLVPTSESLFLEAETPEGPMTKPANESFGVPVRICNLAPFDRTVGFSWMVTDVQGRTVVQEQEKLDIRSKSAGRETVKLRLVKPGEYLLTLIAEAEGAKTTKTVKLVVR